MFLIVFSVSLLSSRVTLMMSPAAIGAQVAFPDRTVWCVAGEGGFVMTAQEMSVAVAQRLPVKVVLLNNFSLGMVRQFQDDYYGGVRSEIDLTVMPDFVKLAEAYGWTGMTVHSHGELGSAFDRAEAATGPVLIDFRIDPEANVYPIVPLGKGLDSFQEAPYDQSQHLEVVGVANALHLAALGVQPRPYEDGHDATRPLRPASPRGPLRGSSCPRARSALRLHAACACRATARCASPGRRRSC